MTERNEKKKEKKKKVQNLDGLLPIKHEAGLGVLGAGLGAGLGVQARRQQAWAQAGRHKFHS